jgi:hypothetical protein
MATAATEREREGEQRLYTEQEVWDKEVKAWLAGWLSPDEVEQSDWRKV